MVFREMRRNQQALSREECVRVLQQATSGVLSVAGDDGYPYGVPLSFAWSEGKLYFHAAKSGHKLDALRRQEKASFCVILQDHVVPEEFTTYYRSVIAFGKVRIIESDDNPEKRRGLDLLADKYCQDVSAKSREDEISKLKQALVVLVLDIEHATGKEARELMEKRQQV